MTFVAKVPVANIPAFNAALLAAGFGPSNANIPVWDGVGPQPVMALVHCIANYPSFQAACAAQPGVTIETYGNRVVAMDPALAAIGSNARWGGNAPLLQGNVTPGLYRAIPADGGALWTVVQAFNRAVVTNPLADIPALVRKAKVPNEIAPWVQPLDQFDAYLLVNPFTGQPDQCSFGGQTWKVSQASGTGAQGGFNTFQPGVFGWVLA